MAPMGMCQGKIPALLFITCKKRFGFAAKSHCTAASIVLRATWDSFEHLTKARAGANARLSMCSWSDKGATLEQPIAGKTTAPGLCSGGLAFGRINDLGVLRFSECKDHQDCAAQ